jgi:hypothetical protein
MPTAFCSIKGNRQKQKQSIVCMEVQLMCRKKEKLGPDVQSLPHIFHCERNQKLGSG